MVTAERIERPIALDDVNPFAAGVRGDVITPHDDRYDSARAVYNAMIDKYPALIVQCADVADVIHGVRFAAERQLPIAVRGGGHNAAGSGTCDSGVVLDLGRMNEVNVDPEKRRVRVGGGATWGDVNHATQVFGLAVPSGIISTTGVGGLTLGGGFGYISRAHGLTIDNLVSADMVLADGSFVTVSASEHPDLFWAIRGGGGNFGVVTSFEFVAHPAGMVTAGVLFYELDKAEALMKLYREFIRTAPRELGLFFGYVMTPPAPFIPEELQMKNLAKIVLCHNGPEQEANRVIAPFLAMEPVLNLVGPMPYDTWNSLFDGLFPAGRQDYWKADYSHDLSDDQIAVHLEHGPRMPNPSCAMHIYSVNGAVQDVGPDETAYSYRDVTFAHVILVTEDDPAKMPGHIDFVRSYWNGLHRDSAGGAYVNFLMEEGSDRVQATYRDNYPRLQRTKKEYDPDNLFRINQNIQPAS
ncbi:MAG: FAD-binding oxidoreductase [Thermomicrobiales bacterium]|nr:FAD-binding oxidoreductase [Thermomicrobiales bacterium]